MIVIKEGFLTQSSSEHQEGQGRDVGAGRCQDAVGTGQGRWQGKALLGVICFCSLPHGGVFP